MKDNSSSTTDLKLAALRFRETTDQIEIARNYTIPPPAPVAFRDEATGQERHVRAHSIECPTCKGRCYPHEKCCAECAARQKATREEGIRARRREAIERRERRALELREGQCEIQESLARADEALARRGLR